MRSQRATLRESGLERARVYEAVVTAVPMGAAIWSCPPRTFMQFPIGFVMKFFAHHRMLQVQGRPAWRVVRGGSYDLEASRTLMRRFVAALPNGIM